MSVSMSLDKNEMYSQILYPKLMNSCNTDFFTRFDYQFISLKDTDGQMAKIGKKSAKLIIILLITTGKIILAVTIITPLVLIAVSFYQNKENNDCNKDFIRKSIALVKASEAHMSLGNVKMAVGYQSDQSKMELINVCSNAHSLRNTIRSFQDRSTLHHNLIVAAEAWRDLVIKKASENTNCISFDKNEFFEYAVQSLVAQGHADQANINSVNANLSLTEDLTVSTRICHR